MTEVAYNCFICEQPVFEGDRGYSYSVQSEKLERDGYAVFNAEAILSTCAKCKIGFDLERQINAKINQHLVAASPPMAPRATDVALIHNTDDCRCCESGIPDGEYLYTGVHSDYLWGHNSIQPLTVTRSFTLCQPCADGTDFSSHVEKIIDHVISVSRTKLIRSVT
jgi:hypothetical protein